MPLFTFLPQVQDSHCVVVLDGRCECACAIVREPVAAEIEVRDGGVVAQAGAEGTAEGGRISTKSAPIQGKPGKRGLLLANE